MVKVTEIKERRQAFPQTSAATRNVGPNIVRDIGKNIVQDMVQDIAHRSIVTVISQPRVLPSGGITFRPRMMPVLPPSAPLRFDVVKTVQEKVYEDMKAALEKEWDIALAAAEGDEERVWRLIKEESGYEPNALFKTALKSAEFPKARRWPLLGLRDALRSHRKRWRKAAEAERVPERNAAVRKGIKRFESVDLALDRLAFKAQRHTAEGQTHEDVLEEMIPGIAYVERAELQSDDQVASKVANQIRREGLERPDDPGKVFAPGPDGLTKHTDELELFAFAQRELLAHKVHEAGLSRQEAESWMYSILLGSDKKAAAVLGRPANQVAQEKLRAKRKLRRSA
jgi:hypothetical protein